MQSTSKEEEEEEKNKQPMLFVDVHVGVDQISRITIFEGDTPEGLAEDFAEKYGKHSEDLN